MPKKNYAIIFLLVAFCSGCAQEYIVEDLGFIHSVGYDLNEAENAKEEGELIATISLPQVTSTAKSDRELLTTIAHTSKGARTKLARQTDRVLVSGQIRTALFSISLAEKKGILDTMDTLQRDHAIGLNLKIIAIDGNSKDLLLSEFDEHPRTSRYIYELVEKEAKGNVTIDTSLHQFIRDYYDDGIDPIIPIIKKGDNVLIMDGIALFQGDRYVDKVNPSQARVFKMLHGDYVGGDLTTEIHLKGEEKESYLYITFDTLESKRKVTVISPTEIKIDLQVKGGIDEYTGHLELSDDEVQKEIEKKLAIFIEGISEELIQKMQEKKSDNLGVGQYVRNRSNYKNWKDMNWKEEVYPDAKIDVNVNVKLKGFGGIK